MPQDHFFVYVYRLFHSGMWFQLFAHEHHFYPQMKRTFQFFSVKIDNARAARIEDCRIVFLILDSLHRRQRHIIIQPSLDSTLNPFTTLINHPVNATQPEQLLTNPLNHATNNKNPHHT